MAERSRDSSVRIFYPAFDRAEVLQILRERLGRVELKLPLVYEAVRATADRMVRGGATLRG